jgi:precorrin isomerase
MGKRQYSQPGFTSSVRNGRQRLKKLQDAIFSREIYATGNMQNKDLINLRHPVGNNASK